MSGQEAGLNTDFCLMAALAASFPTSNNFARPVKISIGTSVGPLHSSRVPNGPLYKETQYGDPIYLSGFSL